jgi:hypothetical protein
MNELISCIRVCNVFAMLGFLSSAETDGHRNKQVMGFNGMANHHVKAKAEISVWAKKLEFNNLEAEAEVEADSEENGPKSRSINVRC